MMGRVPRPVDLWLDRALVRLFGVRLASWLDRRTLVWVAAALLASLIIWSFADVVVEPLFSRDVVADGAGAGVGSAPRRFVGEGHRRIVKKAQRVLFARCEAQEEIVSGSARHTAAPFSASLHGLGQWRLGLVECQPFGENGVVTALDQCDQRRLQRHASIACEIRRVTGAPQYPLHFARPVFFLDFDESLQFAQVMGVAQGVQHARHRDSRSAQSARHEQVLAEGREQGRSPDPKAASPAVAKSAVVTPMDSESKTQAEPMHAASTKTSARGAGR